MSCKLNEINGNEVQESKDFNARTAMRFHDTYSEYQVQDCHIVSNEKNQGMGNGMAEEEATVDFELDYKKEKVKVHLSFSEDKTDKNAQAFWDDLKKFYIGKSGIGTLKIH